MKTLPLALFALMIAALSAQKVEGPVFESVSMKKMETPGFQPLAGGPGTETPTRITMRHFDKMLLAPAFGIPTSEIDLNGKVPNKPYELTATVPSGATKEQVRAMLLNLLTERFHLRYHRETREVIRFELSVGEGGHKLKPSTYTAPAEVPKDIFMVVPGDDGYLVFRPGFDGGPSGLRGKWAMQRFGTSVEELASVLSVYLGATVDDHTGLAGKYDFSLRWTKPEAAATTDPGASDAAFVAAVRQQLGLVLREQKGPVEMIVIDSMTEATPD